MTDGDDEVTDSPDDGRESDGDTSTVPEDGEQASEKEQADESEADEGDDESEADEGDDESEADEGDDESEADVENNDGGDEAEDTEESVEAVSDGGAAEADAETGILDGAPDDEEMPLTEHIEEMLKRLAAVIVVMGGVSLIILPTAPDLINWLWYSFLPGNPEACVNGDAEGTACPRVYHPLGLLLARLKVASLAGLILALPVFVYQTYLFMRPGLYPHERRYYLAAVPTSLVLAFVGVAFAYFLILPFIFSYFLFYSEDVASIAFGLTETFDLILLMLGLFAVIFQIPLFMMLAIMMGVTTRRWLEDKRFLFWLAFAGFAFLFSPDPTGMAPFMVGLTMVALYEITLLLLRWTGR